MSKPINIKLVPSKKNKVYRTTKESNDLYLLSNQLATNDLYASAIDETDISGLELQIVKIKEEINRFYQEESALNVIQNSLETLSRSIKRKIFNSKIPENEDINIDEFNLLLEKYSIIDYLEKLNKQNVCNKPRDALTEIENNLSKLSEHKKNVHLKTRKLLKDMLVTDTKKENICASRHDITLLEVAYRNLKLIDYSDDPGY